MISLLFYYRKPEDTRDLCQSESSIWVTWLALTNQKPEMAGGRRSTTARTARPPCVPPPGAPNLLSMSVRNLPHFWFYLTFPDFLKFRLGSLRTLSPWRPPSTPRPCLSPTSLMTPPSHLRWSCSLTSRRHWDYSISTCTGKTKSSRRKTNSCQSINQHPL